MQRSKCIYDGTLLIDKHCPKCEPQMFKPATQIISVKGKPREPGPMK